ncbi:hypothetical protein P153DRAFT_283887 [Dothidotthia symphoricarpi CBS 119687]|uniref:Uncharacterized protein n=1 Tax=Dothidotthia symphoricarpi CBS 119687 TaxID=1392245 RepID=A0A6A6AQA0_9PLEO|nr:uncharacterized protein P153DRAFT_283887 [Dothidotthia symphoricarpi CBS 119687]KAF2132691.1 hypothetical protein P153DRAFT_283887 [Dothidotthia symphoricarpi CBS 119687]
MSAATIFTVLAGLVAAIGVGVYFFGISPEMKRKLERQALKTMGENKMSYLAKDQINKIPTSDQEDVQELKQGISNIAGGAVNNPLGEASGDFADDLTSPLTGR